LVNNRHSYVLRLGNAYESSFWLILITFQMNYLASSIRSQIVWWTGRKKKPTNACPSIFKVIWTPNVCIPLPIILLLIDLCLDLNNNQTILEIGYWKIVCLLCDIILQYSISDRCRCTIVVNLIMTFSVAIRCSINGKHHIIIFVVLSRWVSCLGTHR